MDEKLKKQIYWAVIIISAIVLVVSLIGNYRTSKALAEDYLVVDRTPLMPFRLINYKETDDGVFIDVVGIKNGKKYENNLISQSCPRGKDKKPGMIMMLSVEENIRTATQETFYTLDRAYDYICSTKNMVEEDTKLFKRIEEARNRALDANSQAKNAIK